MEVMFELQTPKSWQIGEVPHVEVPVECRVFPCTRKRQSRMPISFNILRAIGGRYTNTSWGRANDDRYAAVSSSGFAWDCSRVVQGRVTQIDLSPAQGGLRSSWRLWHQIE